MDYCRVCAAPLIQGACSLHGAPRGPTIFERDEATEAEDQLATQERVRMKAPIPVPNNGELSFPDMREVKEKKKYQEFKKNQPPQIVHFDRDIQEAVFEQMFSNALPAQQPLKALAEGGNYCGACGQGLVHGDKFCRHCGAVMPPTPPPLPDEVIIGGE